MVVGAPFSPRSMLVRYLRFHSSLSVFSGFMIHLRLNSNYWEKKLSGSLYSNLCLLFLLILHLFFGFMNLSVDDSGNFLHLDVWFSFCGINVKMKARSFTVLCWFGGMIFQNNAFNIYLNFVRYEEIKCEIFEQTCDVYCLLWTTCKGRHHSARILWMELNSCFGSCRQSLPQGTFCFFFLEKCIHSVDP